MRIGLVSDSHGNGVALKEAVKRMGTVSAIFHLGDYTADAVTIRQWTETPVFIVKGNMDEYEKEGSLFVKTTIGGKKILACHGHTAGVKNDYDTLYRNALDENVDIVLFGHTHIPIIKATEKVFMMNPGSVALPHFGSVKSFGIITIEDDKMSGDIISLEE